MSITKILEAKDARIERLLGLNIQAQEVIELALKEHVNNMVSQNGGLSPELINQAEIVWAKIQKEREV